MRDLIEKTNQRGRSVALFCDMHGHSRKKNVFIYGCMKKKGHPKRDLRPLEFPYLLDSIAPSFSFLDSRFKIQRSKSQTGRVVGWREFGISQSFTMEASFCGPSKGPGAGSQFRSIDLERMGREFCLTLYAYFKLGEVTDATNNLDGHVLEGLPGRLTGTIKERAEAAMAMLAAKGEKEPTPDSKKDEKQESSRESSSGVSIDEAESDWTDTEDDESDLEASEMSEKCRRRSLSRLTTALASTLTLKQIEALYEGTCSDTFNVPACAIDHTRGAIDAVQKNRKSRRLELEDSGGSDSDASGDNLDEGELRSEMMQSLHPSHSLKILKAGNFDIKGRKKKAKSAKKHRRVKGLADGESFDYLRRQSKSGPGDLGDGAMNLKGAVGRARRRRKKIEREKLMKQQADLELRAKRRNASKQLSRGCWISPNAKHIEGKEADALITTGAADATNSKSEHDEKSRNSSTGQKRGKASRAGQRVPLHTLMQRQQEYLDARQRRRAARVPMKLRSTIQAANSGEGHPPAPPHQHQPGYHYDLSYSSHEAQNVEGAQPMQIHQQVSAFPQYCSGNSRHFRVETTKMIGPVFQRDFPHNSVLNQANPSPLARVDFSFPQINGMHQQLAIRAQSELSESLEKAQKVYDQVIRQRFNKQAMQWNGATQSSLAPNKREETKTMYKMQDHRKSGSFRKSNTNRRKEGDPKKKRRSRKNIVKETSRRFRNGSNQRVQLSKERQLAIQALHAALSGQEAQMIAQLNSEQPRLNEAEDLQLQAQPDEVGYSNYARRGVGKGPLSRAGRMALSKGSGTSNTGRDLDSAGSTPNLVPKPKRSILNESDSATSQSFQRSRSVTKSHFRRDETPGIFYDTGTSYANA